MVEHLTPKLWTKTYNLQESLAKCSIFIVFMSSNSEKIKLKLIQNIIRAKHIILHRDIIYLITVKGFENVIRMRIGG